LLHLFGPQIFQTSYGATWMTTPLAFITTNFHNGSVNEHDLSAFRKDWFQKSFGVRLNGFKRIVLLALMTFWCKLQQKFARPTLNHSYAQKKKFQNEKLQNTDPNYKFGYRSIC